MALQTITALSSSAEPTTTQSHTHNPFLTSSGSPPLILAFLAVGVFVISMLTKFGYRRVRYGNIDGVRVELAAAGTRAGAGTRGRIAPVGRELGDRPTFWDLWTYGPADEAKKWERMVPFSATKIPKEKREDDHDSTPSKPNVEPSHTWPGYHLSSVFSSRSVDETVHAAEPTDATRLQVTVPILMPSKWSKCDEEETLQYAIGVTEVIWKES